MKPLFCILLFPILFLSACKGSNGQSDIEEALSWSFGNDFMYDNWTQINKDFGWDKTSFSSMKWMPKPINEFGEEVPSEMQKDNFGPYAARFVQYQIVDSMIPARLGFSYPDIRWEVANKLVNILKVNDNYQKDSLLKFTKDLDYRPEQYRGFTIYDAGKDFEKFSKANAYWAERTKAICYSEKDHILLLSAEVEFIKENIDAHLDKKSLADESAMIDVVAGIENAESLIIIRKIFGVDEMYWHSSMMQDSIGMKEAEWINKYLALSEKELAQLHEPDIIAIGEGKNGDSFSVLHFKSSQEASSDKEKGLAILKNGRSITSGELLSERLHNASAATNGNCLLLKWETLPSLTLTIDMVRHYDLAWTFSK